MQVQRAPRPRLHIPDRKHVDFDLSSPSIAQQAGGSLSPDLGPNTPPVFPEQQQQQQNDSSSNSSSNSCSAFPGVSKIGRFVLVSPVDTQGQIHIYKSFHADTQQQYLCKVLPIAEYHDSLSPYWRVGSHDHLNEIEHIILGQTHAYIFFGQHYGDLHSYVRTKKRLRESEVSRLFAQIVSALAQCHENGVILRDLKLRKFVFKDPERTELKLVGLEDAHTLADESDDSMTDKHGCPAYVSPEILNPNKSYSGKAADIWSIGVMLYTMLVGRYPFHDRDPSTLFMKIRRGDFTIPDSLSSRAKCLLRSLLRKDPTERLTADEIGAHPWFSSSRVYGTAVGSVAGGAAGGKTGSAADLSRLNDQLVPSINVNETEDFFV